MVDGKPSDFSQSVSDALCARLSQGETLRSICRDKNMPDLKTVHQWLADPDQEVFRAQYNRAEELHADFIADQIVEISDTEDNPQRARVRIEARKWKAAKLHPRAYGDKSRPGPTGDVSFTIITGVPRADD